MINRILVIAEAGVNHNGDLELAKRMIDAAAEAGADLVKFQTFSADRLATRDAAKAIIKQGDRQPGSQHAMLRRRGTTPMHEQLVKRCTTRKIGFCRPDSIESIDLLRHLARSFSRYRRARSTACVSPYRPAWQASDPPSTGMATLGEIEAAIGVIEGRVPRSGITVLHCYHGIPGANVRSEFACHAPNPRGVRRFGVIPITKRGSRWPSPPLLSQHHRETPTLDRNLRADHQASLGLMSSSPVSAIRNIETPW